MNLSHEFKGLYTILIYTGPTVHPTPHVLILSSPLKMHVQIKQTATKD